MRLPVPDHLLTLAVLKRFAEAESPEARKKKLQANQKFRLLEALLKTPECWPCAMALFEKLLDFLPCQHLAVRLTSHHLRSDQIASDRLLAPYLAKPSHPSLHLPHSPPSSSPPSDCLFGCAVFCSSLQVAGSLCSVIHKMVEPLYRRYNS